MVFRTITTIYSYFYLEILRPTVYLNALIVGAIINYLSTGTLTASTVPFIVPIFVQVLTRTSMAYSNRYRDLLLKLPMEREDPVFVMGINGKVLMTGEKTEQFFRRNGIKDLQSYIGDESVKNIVRRARKIKKGSSSTALDVYSTKTQKWYSTKIKVVSSDNDGQVVLLWFADITEQKKLHTRIESLSSFNRETLRYLRNRTENDDIHRRLAELILDIGYQGVFTTKLKRQADLVGKVFKKEGAQFLCSKPIIIDWSSSAPILRSRKQDKTVSGDIQNFSSREEFEKTYPFDNRVKEFLSFPIDNFVNYHGEEFSIIAFNRQNNLTKIDTLFIETLVINTRAMFQLFDLALRNEEQFLQKVMGLCSAAEHSDEITGKHILRVNKYAKLIAIKMNLGDEFITTISQVAALHDIGKVAIQELIKSNKKYTPEKREMMRMHTIYGAQILQTMMSYSSKDDSKMRMAYNIALHHHQSWNGKGYPKLKVGKRIAAPDSKNFEEYRNQSALSGDEIPIEALITGLADSYDALRSERQYKAEFSHQKTIEILSLDDRTQTTGEDRFGLQIWQLFIQCEEEFAHIFESMRD